jgi:hypothetical protein
LLALILGPWLGWSPARSAEPDTGIVFSQLEAPPETDRDPAAEAAAPARARSGGCNCRTVNVKMRNLVRNARVRTGDAKVVNFNITYVSANYGDRDVEVEQEALAVSGDAVAGQLIDVDARGPGCVNVQVHATNRVEDSTVRSGDATAINQSIVLLDPGVSAGDLEVDVEQEATAVSGDAIAGQVMGLVSGGGSRGCRGRVDLRAVNEVLDTKVLTGDATFLNKSEVRTCAARGCADELHRLLGRNTELEVCTGTRCRGIDAEDLGAVLNEEATRADDDPDDDDESEEGSAPSVSSPPGCSAAEQAAYYRSRQSSRHDRPSPSPTPAPQSSSAPQSSEAPGSPAPEPPPGCASPTPAPTASPGLLVAAGTDESAPAS